MKFIPANWDAPKFVKAYTTTLPDDTYASDYNLCLKNAIDLAQTQTNRLFVKKRFDFKKEPAWLNQVHSSTCIDIPKDNLREADASYTQDIYQPLVILTADCLPILITHLHKPEIAAIHAGWKGIYAGIIENTVSKLSDSLDNYSVWFGPAICKTCYPVSEEFRANFLSQYPNTEDCFIKKEQWHFSLTSMSDNIFKQLGIRRIFHSNLCTFENKAFYSYRRDNGQTGRIATFIWLEGSNETL